jgi:hypothetical protein
MTKQGLVFVLAVLIAAAAVDAIPDVRHDLIVHEWGTFTTVAVEDGRAVPWRPLDGAAELPCFVERAELPPKTSFVSTVRMETPVIYFYTPRPLTADVAVRFRQGLMTEFYPHATSSGRTIGVLARPASSRLEWNGIRVMPGSIPVFPSEEAPNHYYAARAADAAPLHVGTQQEGFLFYRGIGGFDLPLRAMPNPHEGIDLTNDGADHVSTLVLFENRGGRIGFRTSWSLGDQVTLPPLTLDSTIASVRQALVRMLIGEGLYLQEAEAMVETWSGSWFEEGIRVFYVVPRSLVDDTLPLTIRPMPGAVERVFVARLEIATPRRLDDLHAAFRSLDYERLAAHGRFLEPFSRRILDRDLPTDDRQRVLEALARHASVSPGKACAPRPDK